MFEPDDIAEVLRTAIKLLGHRLPPFGQADILARFRPP